MSEHQSTNPRMQLQDQDHHRIRRSSSRRKANGGYDSKKHKQRRRGMGIAKLEQQIFQDMWKTAAASYPHSSTSNHHDLTRSDHRLLRYQQYSNFLAPNCDSLQCNACHKKKKINGGNDPRFVVVENQNKMKEDNLGKKVEVVAIHRKGSCSSGDDVLMEYDFFPSTSIDSDKSLGSSSSMAGFDVDLSLKLSY